MKRPLLKYLSSLCLLLLCSCSSPQNIKEELNLSGIVKSGELTTLECYYHNVAKGTKDPGDGLINAGQIQRKFYIEYTGKATFSFDTSKIEIEENGLNVKIKLPEPMINCNPDSFDLTRSVENRDTGLIKNPIKDKDWKKAIEEADAKMEESAKSNSPLKNQAVEQAKAIIENQIKNIGLITEKNYNVTWVE